MYPGFPRMRTPLMLAKLQLSPPDRGFGLCRKGFGLAVLTTVLATYKKSTTLGTVLPKGTFEGPRKGSAEGALIGTTCFLKRGGEATGHVLHGIPTGVKGLGFCV